MSESAPPFCILNLLGLTAMVQSALPLFSRSLAEKSGLASSRGPGWGSW